jgi:hypothetical protein
MVATQSFCYSFKRLFKDVELGDNYKTSICGTHENLPPGEFHTPSKIRQSSIEHSEKTARPPRPISISRITASVSPLTTSISPVEPKVENTANRPYGNISSGFVVRRADIEPHFHKPSPESQSKTEDRRHEAAERWSQDLPSTQEMETVNLFTLSVPDLREHPIYRQNPLGESLRRPVSPSPTVIFNHPEDLEEREYYEGRGENSFI